MQWATAGGLDVKSAGGLATWTVGGWRDRAMDGGLKRAADGGGLEGLTASRLEAIPLNSNGKYRAGWWAVTSKPNGETWTGIKNNFSKNEQNKTRWVGAAYCLGLVFCHGAHNGEERGTRSKLKIKPLINPKGQDKARLRQTGTQGYNE